MDTQDIIILLYFIPVISLLYLFFRHYLYAIYKTRHNTCTLKEDISPPKQFVNAENHTLIKELNVIQRQGRIMRHEEGYHYQERKNRIADKDFLELSKTSEERYKQ